MIPRKREETKTEVKQKKVDTDWVQFSKKRNEMGRLERVSFYLFSFICVRRGGRALVKLTSCAEKRDERNVRKAE